MTIQDEVIRWHKYPDEKPTEGSRYYYVDCSCWYFGKKIIEMLYVDGKFEYHTQGFDDCLKHIPSEKIFPDVIAWAEMPKGWKE